MARSGRTDACFRSGGRAGHPSKVRGQFHWIFEGSIIPHSDRDTFEISSIGIGSTHFKGKYTPCSGSTRNHTGGNIDTHPARRIREGITGWTVGRGNLISKSHTGGCSCTVCTGHGNPRLSNIAHSTSINLWNFSVGKKHIIKSNIIQPHTCIITNIRRGRVIIPWIVFRPKNQSRVGHIHCTGTIFRSNEFTVGKNLQFTTSPNSCQMCPVGYIDSRSKRVIPPRASKGKGYFLLSTISAHLPTLTRLSPFRDKGFPSAVRKFLGPKGNGKLIAPVKCILSGSGDHHIMITIQIRCFSGSKGSVGFVLRVHQCMRTIPQVTMIIISGWIFHGGICIAVEFPPTNQVGTFRGSGLNWTWSKTGWTWCPGRTRPIICFGTEKVNGGWAQPTGNFPNQITGLGIDNINRIIPWTCCGSPIIITPIKCDIGIRTTCTL